MHRMLSGGRDGRVFAEKKQTDFGDVLGKVLIPTKFDFLVNEFKHIHLQDGSLCKRESCNWRRR